MIRMFKTHRLASKHVLSVGALCGTISARACLQRRGTFLRVVTRFHPKREDRDPQ